MQSGGGHGRNTAASASASPSSSSSGFDPIQQQQQQLQQRQQQELQQRQSFHQQLLRKPDGNEAMLGFQGGLHGVLGGNFGSNSGPMQLPVQSRKFTDLGQQHGSPHNREEAQNRSQGFDQQMLNPVQQAYLQYHSAQQKSALGMQSQHSSMVGHSGKDHGLQMGNMKIPDLMSMQATQAPPLLSNKPSEHFVRGEKINEDQQQISDQRSDSKQPVVQTSPGQLIPGNVMRPMQNPQQSIQNMNNSQLAMAAQMQAMQALALERNIDLSNPANANLVAQLIPFIQSRMVAQHKANESSMGAQSSLVPMTKQQVTSPQVANESSPRGNSSSDLSGHSASGKAVRQAGQPGAFGASTPSLVHNANNNPSQPFSGRSSESQLSSRQPTMINNASMHPPQSSVNLNQGVDHSAPGKSKLSGPEALQMQYNNPIRRSSPLSTTSSSEGKLVNPTSSQGGPLPHLQQPLGFTKQQSHVLKAQILAFRRLKKGDGTLPRELLQAIVPPPLEKHMLQMSHPGATDASAGKNAEAEESSEKDPHAGSSTAGLTSLRREAVAGDEKTIPPRQILPAVPKEPSSSVPSREEEHQTAPVSAKIEEGEEHGMSEDTITRSDMHVNKGKAVAITAPLLETVQVKKPLQATTPQPKEAGATRKYHGPLFDFPFFTRKHDSFGSAGIVNNNNNMTLAYDLKDLLFEEGREVLSRKRTENIRKIGDILAVNLERKRIRPDLVLRLQIEEKKLKLLDVQARLRDEVDQHQQDIMAMPDRPYRKFVRLCERQRADLSRKVQASQKAIREKQLKSIFQWRKKLLEAHWAIRDARTARNRGVAKYHERMLKEFSKRKDDDRSKRMEALKNNDVERYREMLLEQQTSIPGDGAERYAVLSSFLSQTEEYLHKLGSKITATKSQQEVEEAANAAAAAARAQGLSEEEVRAAAACAGEEVTIRNRFSEMNAPKDSSSVNKYYNLAHAVNERVFRQPSMLRAGTLRDYQIVGLQWMLSLYNNKLNGILADEMGLGKTVQVMALIAYLMEFKGNYGPHLIIVPNAVLVNWKSELHNWLPSVSCIYYVGQKDQRIKLFQQEVCAMKFNVLVTTYEFVMYDRAKLSKVDWKYIIIDEAQRMKDRESVLARDLDRYRCQRRLLLTGTPLQNDLKELWSLLNLLLPEVFDNRKAFHDWFSKPFQREGPSQNVEDDWLETEKKVIIIHRLHQILEPFMLRRRVEDVEGSLPPKVSIILRCRMSAIQGAIYDWIKATGTLRVDPEDEKLMSQKKPTYQTKVFRTLANRCMELRKTCNHPLLNYPYFNDFSKDFLVRSCGKLFVLDRILIKLQRTGHRVLLFSTMTKLLDILEEYLQWRRLIYRRIDGSTSLEDRESAIVDFNSPDTDCFIFLLSIRAAGRGLNLQTADTVVIYDPDPNPKNEEQAVARAHRIGQQREVKVIYLEAVVDKISSHQKEDEYRSGGTVDSEDDLAGKDRYMGSIEGLIRNNIQQYKIDMADEVINAGRFDQRTTHEERRLTLESMLHDEERYQETVHDVPSLQEVNRMIARSEEEVELFDQMDEEFDWEEDMTRYDQVPKWLRASSKEVNDTIAKKSSKKSALFGGNIGAESNELEKKRGRTKGKKFPVYTELDDEIDDFSEASSEERNGYSGNEEGEIGDLDDEDFVADAPAGNNHQPDDGTLATEVYEDPRPSEGHRPNHIPEEAGSSGSSSGSRRLIQMVSPSISAQKFGSLSALDARPGSVSNRLPNDLEEGEIALSGDSLMDRQHSGSWIQDRDEGEDEQVLQPKIKRKRSIRIRPRLATEKPEEKATEKLSLRRGDSSQVPSQMDHKYESRVKNDREQKLIVEPNSQKLEKSDPSLKTRRGSHSRKNSNSGKLLQSQKPGKVNVMSAPLEDGTEHSRESWDNKAMYKAGNSIDNKMSDAIQHRCKNVINKFQRRLDREGHQIVPLLTELWKKSETTGYMGGNSQLDIRKIYQRLENFDYNGVMELCSDVQLMLKGAIQYYGFSHEVRTEARKVHDLFFDLLKVTLPEIDFREARSAVSFSGHAASSSAPSSRQILAGQGKRQKQANEVDLDHSHSQKQLSRVSHANEDTRSRSHMPQRETRFGSSNSNKESGQHEDSRLYAHPGELVICKKKRKDREKSVVKSGNGSASQVSPASVGRIRSPGSGSVSKDTRLVQQTSQQQGWTNSPQQGSDSRSGGIGWANPVKRMRTDTGKRRPSQL
ncbi:ATP-dependent helicase BRM [Heracleum sosnowskyi]|uniref:ATP-dependent helicase BRM n=1 Tax=Heracleum sosnowskyi TaxID=360622 RepID=A0AAD8I213_9APIA|nr:ATP-dependent helicase BRM [Heracleum sosnowskyi]